jgi:hypothetical protein
MTSPNKVVIKSYLTPEEYKIVENLANECGFSMSTFVKNACLGVNMKSKIDHKAVLAVIKVSADLGRIGGLLKLGLTQKKLKIKETVPLLDSILELKNELKMKIEKL